MLSKNIIILIFVLCIVFVVIFLFNGCSEKTDTLAVTTNISYSTFELKADDINLRYFQHPLYTFEYPSDFKLVDENLADIPHIYTDQTRIYFTIQRTDTPEPQLSITVQKPGNLEYKNASEKLEYTRSYVSSASPINLTTKRTEVYGISSYYLEAFLTHGESPFYPEYQSSQRHCIFDYKGLIWEITLDWCYHGEEPSEVQQYFDHIIKTFKILN